MQWIVWHKGILLKLSGATRDRSRHLNLRTHNIQPSKGDGWDVGLEKENDVMKNVVLFAFALALLILPGYPPVRSAYLRRAATERSRTIHHPTLTETERRQTWPSKVLQSKSSRTFLQIRPRHPGASWLPLPSLPH